MHLLMLLLLSLAPQVPQPTAPPPSLSQAAPASETVAAPRLEVMPCDNYMIKSKQQGEIMKFRLATQVANEWVRNSTVSYPSLMIQFDLDTDYVSRRASSQRLMLLTGSSLEQARQLKSQIEDEKGHFTFRKPPGCGGEVREFAITDGTVQIMTRLDFDQAILYDPATGEEIAELTYVKEE